MDIVFRGWRRPAIGALVTEVTGGRAVVKTTVSLGGSDAAGAPTGSRSAELGVRLAGPDDVAGLHPAAVSRRFPSPGTPDAESTKCPYAEFADAALPWRYSPARTPAEAVRKLRPWLVLLVGTPDEVELGVATVTLKPSVLTAHPLAQSHRWAHVQEEGGRALARVLSPRPLAKDTEYVAVLVPGYVAGADAWATSPGAPVVLPAYAHWSLHTGPDGDFRALATRLRPGDADASIGLADVSYLRVGSAPPLSIRGALAPIGEVVVEELPAEVRDDLAGLRISGRDDVGRPVLGLPTYGELRGVRTRRRRRGGNLNRDPRRRGVAGVGMQVGVETQEDLVEEALANAGSLKTAAESVRDLTLGLAAAGALWRRRLPVDPGRRLWLLGPALQRVATPDGTVDELATADDRSLPRGWFSTAARRVLRPRTPRMSLAGPTAADPASLQTAANRPQPRTPLDRCRHAGSRAPRGTAVRPAPARSRPRRGTPECSHAGGLVRRPGSLAVPEAGHRAGPAPATHQDPRRPRGRGAVGTDDRAADRHGGRRGRPAVRRANGQAVAPCADRAVRPQCRRPPGHRRPARRPRRAARVRPTVAAGGDDRPGGADGCGVRPDRSTAPARRRVLDRVQGLDPARPLAPPEPCLGLDLPMWRHLAATAPDWLLPGVGQLGEDVVIGVSTNQDFVDAFLVGLNTRMLEELRWRNVRVASGCTPLRTFWQRADRADGARVDDILGVQHWDDDTGLGAPQHQPPGLAGADLVLVFRSRLFARYPKTLLYLISAERNGVPDFTTPPSDLATRTLPSFQGRVGADVTFFGFDGLPPEQVRSLWIALEEPPAGVTFRNDVPAASTTDDGAAFADVTLADPLRVLIRGDRLVPGGAS